MTTIAPPQATATPISNGEQRSAARPWQSAQWRFGVVLSGVRVVVGFLFFCHGLLGTLGLFGGVDGKGAAVPAGSFGWYTSGLELLIGTLIAVGLFTKTVAIFGSGMMAFAYFTVHQPMGALPLGNMGEPAVLFCWIFLLIGVAGPGRYALDTLLRRRGASSGG